VTARRKVVVAGALLAGVASLLALRKRRLAAAFVPTRLRSPIEHAAGEGGGADTGAPPPRKRRSRVRRRHKIVLTCAVVAVVASVLGVASFATFNAQTNNPSNTFAHATLVLSNTKQGGSACLSTGGSNTNTNSNTGCDQLLNLTSKKPGDSGTANLTVKNVGSLNASTFKLFAPSCTNADVAGETYHGTGNPCSILQLYVQQWTDNTFTTASACLYGGATGNTCNFSDATKTLGAFSSSYSSSSNGLSIGSGLNAGSSVYITIGVQSPSSADNSYQGRQASIDFDWYIAQ
jgi:hypothetical protein